MEKSVFVGMVILSLIGCGVQNSHQGSNLQSAAAPTFPADRGFLQCAEPKTFVDHPGFEHLIKIEDQGKAEASSRAISMEQVEPFTVLFKDGLALESLSSERTLTINSQKPVFTETDTCVRPYHAYRLEPTGDASGEMLVYKGSYQVIPKVNGRNPNCRGIRPMLPPRQELACTRHLQQTAQ